MDNHKRLSEVRAQETRSPERELAKIVVTDGDEGEEFEESIVRSQGQQQ